MTFPIIVAFTASPSLTPYFVSFERASTDIQTIANRLALEYREDKGVSAYLVSAEEEVAGNFRTALLILLGAAGFVLLVACTNLANLLLARVVGREKEMAIRSGLGATRARLARQLLTESMVLAFLGGALGLLLAAWGMDLFRKAGSRSEEHTSELQSQSNLVCRLLLEK